MSNVIALSARLANKIFPSNTFTSMKVKDFIELVDKSKIDTQPIYQRNPDRWSTAKQKELINTAMSEDMFMPVLAVQKKKLSDGTITLHLIDGQQRTMTLKKFKDNNLRDQNDRLYSEYSPEEQEQFDNYAICIFATEMNDERAQKQFSVLQNGKNLNGAEKRHALIAKHSPAMVNVSKLAKVMFDNGTYGECVKQRNDNYKCDDEILKFIATAYVKYAPTCAYLNPDKLILDEQTLNKFAEDNFMSQGGASSINADLFDQAISDVKAGMQWVAAICTNKNWSSTKRVALFYAWLHYRNEKFNNIKLCQEKLDALNLEVSNVDWDNGETSKNPLANQLHEFTRGAMNSGNAFKNIAGVFYKVLSR